MTGLILASASPRRAALLAGLGLDFRVEPSLFEERHTDRPTDPAALVETLALGKARDVARRYSTGLVLGADTVVIQDGTAFEKPADAREARSMLSRLAGRWHVVYTGVALADAATAAYRVGHEKTRVKFRSLTPDEIEAYVATGEPLDKAGGYGIQGLGAVLIERIDGCYTNVVGLPMARLALMLKEFGINVLQHAREKG